MERGAWRATSPRVRRVGRERTRLREPPGKRYGNQKHHQKEEGEAMGWEGAKEDEMKMTRTEKQKFQEPQEPPRGQSAAELHWPAALR